MCYLRLKHSFVVEPGGREFPLLSPLQSLNSPSSQDACATFLILVNYLSLFDNFEWQHICENTFGWQYPYSVQHSAHPGHPSTWSSSSLGVLLVKIIANALWTTSKGRLIISHLKNLKQGGWTWTEPQHKTHCLFQLRDILPRCGGPAEEEVPDYDND